jgi:hypothetical protein
LLVPGISSGTPASSASLRRTTPAPNNRPNPQSRQVSPAANANSEPPLFIGPTGYDVGN